MEILVGLGSLAFSLFLTVVSVKLAAGWLKAEHSGWGRCIVALLLAYVVGAVIGVVAGILAGLLGEPINLVVLVVALVVAILAPVIIFARILGTSGLRAFGIMLIAALVNVLIMVGIVFAVVTVLGIGLAGLGAMLGMGAMMPGAGGEALDRFEQDVEQLCACSDQACVDRVSTEMLDGLMAAMQAGMMSGDPADQARFEALSQRMEQCQDPGAAAQPAPQPMPEPAPAPQPMPEPAPAPQPMPEPAPAPQPMPEPAPAPQPMPEPAPAPQPMPEPVPAPQPAPGPAPAVQPAATPPAAPVSPVGRSPYAYRDVDIADIAAQVGKLVRLSFADGTRLRDQLVAVEGDTLTLKRGKSEGGGSYSVRLSEVVRLEVFDR